MHLIPERGEPQHSEITRLPLGVVTIVVPFAWPLAVLGAALPYALITGNTTVIKPAPTCPLALIATVRRLAARLPPGVVNVVCGAHDAVAPLLTDRRVRRITFTGNSAGGVEIMRSAAATMTRVTLELGGNDPAFVLDDANLDDTTLRRLVTASFTTSGQICLGIKRIYVHRNRYTELVDGMTRILRDARIGHGLAPGTTMGPLHTASRRRHVLELIAESRAAGTEVRELGTLDPAADPHGYFVRPALVLDPPPGAPIVTREQFGPALPILPIDDLDAVIDRTNDEWAGLCSSVWTSDPARAAAVAARLRTGTTWINSAGDLDERAPFGGFRGSGLGRELGQEGLCEFTEAHTITYPA